MLVTCPECGKTISEDANPCTYCGKPMAGYKSEESEMRREEERKEWKEEAMRRKKRATLRERKTTPALSPSEVRRLKRRGKL